MRLDDLDYFKSVDTQAYLSQIDWLPDQILAAWEFGRLQTPPRSTAEQVLVAGVGDAAVAGELAAALTQAECRAPIQVWRDFGLPAWVGPGTLVIALSHSGDDVETVDAAEAAVQRGAGLLAISSGGRLAALDGAAVWRIPPAGDARTAFAQPLILTLTALAKLGLIADPSSEVIAAAAALRAQRDQLQAASPVSRNPAKRMAGQLMDRLLFVFGAGYLAPVARRWAGQVQQTAKAGAWFAAVPEMGHNAVAGVMQPEALLSRTMVLALRSSRLPAALQALTDSAREAYLVNGFNTDTVDAAGDSPLAHALTALHYGDYVAYYLAMCYGIDPAPVPGLAD